MARGQVEQSLTIRNTDILNKVNKLAEREKHPDEAQPNPHRIARKLLREASNAWLLYPDLYEQLMNNISQIEKQNKRKTD